MCVCVCVCVCVCIYKRINRGFTFLIFGEQIFAIYIYIYIYIYIRVEYKLT